MKERGKLTEAEIERLLTAEFPQTINRRRVCHRCGLVPRLPRPQAFRSAIFAPGRDDRWDDHDGARGSRPYVAIHASIGWAPMAVTTNLSINFLKRPAQKDLLAETRLIKVCTRFAVADIAIARKERTSSWPTRPRPTRSHPPTLVDGEIIPHIHPIEIVSKYGFAAVDPGAECG